MHIRFQIVNGKSDLGIVILELWESGLWIGRDAIGKFLIDQINNMLKSL